MNYFKINYGNDDNYDIILANNDVNELKILIEDIQNIFQSNLGVFLESQEGINPSTFHWVEFSIDDFIKLGYKKVRSNSIIIKYSFADEDNNIQLMVDETLTTLETENKLDLTLYEICILSEFEPGNSFSSYFLYNEKDSVKFNLEIVNYINSNPIVFNSEVIPYLESLEVYMISIGCQIINPMTYQILCSHTLKSIPEQWQEILGNDLYSNIKNIEKPIIIINREDIQEGLPF